MDSRLYFYRVVEFLGNYDGDTVDVRIDLGLHTYTETRLRLWGVDTPELRGDEREAGLLARAYTRGQFATANEVVVRTFKDRTSKYGEWLAVVFIDGMNLNARLVELGFAREYMKDRPWPTLEE